jgi:hypothetical protein
MSDPVFESRRVQHFSLLRIVHIVYGTRPASYSMGTGMLLRGHKLEGGVAHSPPNVTVNNGCYHVCPNV